jgi:membrane protein implicated in regulation of membrane protease activity
MSWWVWVIVAVGLAIGEIFTPGLFFLGPVAIAAGLAAVAAVIGAGSVVSTIVFIAGALGSLLFLRPIARRHLHVPAISRTGTAALVGRTAIVTRRVDAAGGLVRIGGEEWTARPFLDGDTFDEGVSVEVAEIKGATALVIA